MTPRNRWSIVAIGLAVGLGLLVGGHYFWSGDEETKPVTELETLLAEAPSTLDPDGKAAEFYAGSPWERFDNLFEELITLISEEGENRLPDARAFTQASQASLEALCAEQQKLLDYNPGKWGAVAAFHAPRRAGLLARGKEIVDLANETDQRDLRALLELFDCR